MEICTQKKFYLGATPRSFAILGIHSFDAMEPKFFQNIFISAFG